MLREIRRIDWDKKKIFYFFHLKSHTCGISVEIAHLWYFSWSILVYFSQEWYISWSTLVYFSQVWYISWSILVYFSQVWYIRWSILVYFRWTQIYTAVIRNTLKILMSMEKNNTVEVALFRLEIALVTYKVQSYIWIIVQT